MNLFNTMDVVIYIDYYDNCVINVYLKYVN